MYKESKKFSLGKIILGIGLAGCLFGNLALGAYQIRQSDTSSQKVGQFIDDQLEKQAKEAEKKNTYQEDGFVVADQYEIRSTKAISDAYLKNDDSSLNAEEKETLKLAKDILEKITKNCKNNYEKEKAVYDWMYKNITFNDGSIIAMPSDLGNRYTPYGVLKGQKAVCVGYATTFRLFMNMLGLECHVVHNDSHSWGLVQLDDKEWYHVDIYSDVTSNSKYLNFNMPDGIAKNNLDWDGSMLPVAKGTKYTYPLHNHEEVKNLYAVPKKIKNALEKKKSALCLSFKKKLTDKDLALANVMISNITSALYDIPKYEDYGINAYWYDDEKGSYILGIFIGYYNTTTNDNDVPKKDKKKIISAIEEAFGITIN
ncbi:MAG: transglutaminase domain-containing protein [Lachnospiraceae bacterium]|nr:transglutaminase domain-containing protein [Lachnospiraceae bacterium]